MVRSNDSGILAAEAAAIAEDVGYRFELCFVE